MIKDIIWNGIIKDNPLFVIMLGMCSALAITVSLENAIGMGIAIIFVLACSNIMISSLRDYTPSKVRIPVFVVIIASFVTITSLFMEAFLPSLFSSLGIYVPLIVVNCIILGRAEAFSYKNKVLPSAIDGLAMGVGFMLSLALIAFVREVLSTGKIVIMGSVVLDTHSPILIGIMILPPGAYLVMGLFLALLRGLRK